MKKNMLGVAAATALMMFASSAFAVVGPVSLAGVKKGSGYYAKIDVTDPSYNPEGNFETECDTWIGPLLMLDEVDGEDKEIISVLQTSVVTKIPVYVGYELRPHKDTPAGPDMCFITHAYLGVL